MGMNLCSLIISKKCGLVLSHGLPYHVDCVFRAGCVDLVFRAGCVHRVYRADCVNRVYRRLCRPYRPAMYISRLSLSAVCIEPAVCIVPAV